METIDALAEAINDFEGGMVCFSTKLVNYPKFLVVFLSVNRNFMFKSQVLVSHDFRLINQVAEEIWICEKGTVTKWKGNILDYKDQLKSSCVPKEAKENGKRN